MAKNRCRRCYLLFEVEAPPPPLPAEEEHHPDVAAGVRGWRRVRGLTQKQLASAAHLPRTYISRIENGRILPGLTTLERVALALQVGLPSLLDRTNGRSGNGQSRQLGGNGNGTSLSWQAQAVPQNGNGNGNGHYNGNGSNGDGDDFLRQILRYSGQLTAAQRAQVMARVRQLANARN